VISPQRAAPAAEQEMNNRSVEPARATADMCRRKRCRGQALTEFAIAIPVLLLLLNIAIDFGRAFYFDLCLRDAAFAGARYGGMNPNDDAGIKNATIAAAPSGVVSAGQVVVSGSPPRASFTAISVSVTYTFRPLTPMISNLTGGGIALQRTQTDIIK
jgi:hypothetical protein